jgi:hypothetical protein
MKKTPLALVKERFKTKQDLVKAVQALATEDLWLDQLSEDKGLERVSNAKLIRLQRILQDAKKRFGTRAKLVGAIQEIEKRSKDDGYKSRLESFPLPRLVDLHDAAEARARRAAKPKATKKKKPARSRKAKAKAKAGAKA